MENWQRYAGTATQFSNKLTTGYNPLEDDKEYVGTRLLDAIESGVGSLWEVYKKPLKIKKVSVMIS